MTSIFPIAYGCSKFVSGVLGARSSPRVMLAGGLMATALINVAFGFGHSMVWFSCFWALNGILQGFGGPCCARILTSWFATKERGTYWGMWNIAHNLGGFSAPLLAGTCARNYGWKWGEPPDDVRTTGSFASGAGTRKGVVGGRAGCFWQMLPGSLLQLWARLMPDETCNRSQRGKASGARAWCVCLMLPGFRKGASLPLEHG